jgi:phospholipid/cholesterol/gamma-HCH transport system ATP-binding protein
MAMNRMSSDGTNGKPPAICFKHVFKAFGSNQVLNDISISIPEGQSFALLGRSGTGKSVTLSLMIGLIPVDRGAVLIEGKEVGKLKRNELLQLRKRVGFLFQQGALFDSLSVRDNVAFALRRHTHKGEKEIREIVHKTLESVGLGKDEDKMPAALSGGMQKRVGLARALALDPPIIMADEPSSGLDAITASEIYDLLSTLKEHGKTLVVVTHDGARVRSVVDQVVVLNQGRIAASGSPDELAESDDSLVRDLVTAQKQ